MSYRRLLLTAAATSLALAACNQKPAGPVTGAPIASLPLAEAAPPPETPAPYADALPAAPPITRVSHAPRPVYAYVDDAYTLSDALADSPPDYTVDYDGVRPWVWRSADGEYRVCEDTPDGERTYYYRGDSDYPYLIEDPQYAYAYDDGGELVEVYDSYGRPYPNYAAAALEIAARYLVRGRHLHYAAIHDQRQAAYASDWRARRDVVLAPQRQWASEQQRNPDWRQYHDQRAQQPRPQQAALQQERIQRQAYAARLAPVIAAAPATPRPQALRHAGQPPAAPAFAGQGLPGQGREQERQQQIQAGAAARGQAQAEAGAQQRDQQQRAQAEATQRQQQAQARDQQQRAQAAAAGRTQAEAVQRQQQQAQAKNQQQERDQQKVQAEAAQRQQAQARDQQKAQAEASNRAQQQAQARDQQKAQAEAANHARDDAGRRAQAQAQAAAQHQQQAQAQAQAAQQHQQQAQAQAAAQHQQAAAAHAAEAQQHQQQQQAAAQQHAAQAAAVHVTARPQPQTEKKPDPQKQ